VNKRLTYVCALAEHASHIAPRLRGADVQEVAAYAGVAPLRALCLSMRASSLAVTAVWDGEPVGMFGVVPVSTVDGIGAPWMLGTPRVDRLAREWLIEAPQWLTMLGDGYFVLRNWVDARNVRSIAWLRRMGFSVAKPEPYGAAGLPFRRFERNV
jgi:hypothetical protein